MEPRAVPREAFLSARTLLLWVGGCAALAYSLFAAISGFDVDGHRYYVLADDAMISMRYAQNLAHGHGLVWNPGEPPVEGYTNLLWTLVMAVPHLFQLPQAKICLSIIGLGAVLLLLNLAVITLLVSELSRRNPGAILFAAVSVGFHYSLIAWTLWGFEVGLITLCVDTALLLAVRLSSRFSACDLASLAFVVAVATTTRIDAVVPAGIAAAYAVLIAERGRRRIVATTMAFALAGPLAAMTLFRVRYYGAILPNTYYLKMTGAGAWERFSRGASWALSLSARHLLPYLFLAAVGLRVAWRERNLRNEALLLAAVFAGQFAYSVYAGGDVWERHRLCNRFISVGFPALVALASLGVSAIANVRREVRTRIVAAAAVYAGLLVIDSVAWLSAEGADVASSPPMATVAKAVGAFGLVALACSCLWLRGIGEARPWAAAATTLVAWAMANGQAIADWSRQGAVLASEVRLALLVDACTARDASVAVMVAGIVPYFSGRRAVDLLGKSDPVIARSPPKIPFAPGHDKWDFDYSIGKLKPDLVSYRWGDLGGDPADWTVRYGYESLPNGLSVARNSSRVNRLGIAADWYDEGAWREALQRCRSSSGGS
jgi:arabinofuranosyltransferase